MRPIIINNVLHSARILGDACEKLGHFSVEGTDLDQARVSEYVQRSLMLVTALSPHIGYDKAAAVAHKADDDGTTLREAALALGVPGADFDRSWIRRRWSATPRVALGYRTASDRREVLGGCRARSARDLSRSLLTGPSSQIWVTAPDQSIRRPQLQTRRRLLLPSTTPSTTRGSLRLCRSGTRP